MTEKILHKPGIYKLTNKINNKIYIGKTTDLYRRIIWGHKRSEKKIIKDNGSLITRAIKKYKWINFDIEIIEEFEQINNVELLALETGYIEYFNSLNPNGYNLCVFSTDRTGFKHSLNTKIKMSKNSAHYMLGKKLSEKTKEKISNARLGKSLEYLKKPVKQIDINTNEIIKIWPSAKDASLSFTGKCESSIRHVCNKYISKAGFPFKTAFGYKWEYV